MFLDYSWLDKSPHVCPPGDTLKVKWKKTAWKVNEERGIKLSYFNNFNDAHHGQLGSNYFFFFGDVQVNIHNIFFLQSRPT